ncbi:MAG TPA: OmpH family outer membrane protein [Spirochaetales bacterium]|nr:OmpH family outer membrane protein [Spirochaetales bacterium]HPB66318.1 OmpH family outer membrane protein [Spirochaetales bacterium]HPG85547.1 OmpH family outer membrane protein [Spirochaetales bacterium]HPM72311.1 OmpH family outer membrane protein [Spirochaetales bacterium]
MKKTAIIGLALFALCAQAFGQQITRVGVIDLQKVYTTYYKDSQAVRALEEEKARVNEEIKRLSEEIKELQKRRLGLLSSADAAALKTFDEELYRKAQFLSDFVKIKQADLDAKAESMTKGDAFVQMLYRTVQAISEAEGFSLVISSRNASDVGSSVIWFSPMIDITDKVIQALLGA